MKSKLKKPSVKLPPNPGKHPNAVVNKAGSNTILWSFTSFDDCPHWHSKTGESHRFCDIVEHIKDLERRGWNDIISHPDRDHPISCEKLDKPAQERLVERHIDDVDDVDEIWSFRCTGEQRIWGIKVDSIIRVLWWDPYNKVYPVELQNT